MERNSINTFIFVDIEATGLPFMGPKIKMTELSLISVGRNQILNCRSEDCIPRVKNKISLIFNPKVIIPDEVVQITGLSNELVEDENSFNNEHASLIRSFLKNCIEPICLVAHNGNRFDFRLLKEEFKQFEQIIPDTVLCADSLLAFRNLSQASDRTGTLGIIVSQTDVLLYEASEKIEKIFETSCSTEVIQNINEMTPPARVISSVLPPMKTNVKRKLFSREKSPRKALTVSFTLKNIYYSIFNEPITKAHEAENDVISLIKCCVKVGEPILKYFDDNCVQFKEIIPLY